MDALENQEEPKKRFDPKQARYLLAHSTDYDRNTVEVDELVFYRMLRLVPKRAEMLASTDWRTDPPEEPAIEQTYKEWEAYFHPDVDMDASDLLFNRKMLEEDAGMSADRARKLYNKTRDISEIGDFSR